MRKVSGLPMTDNIEGRHWLGKTLIGLSQIPHSIMRYSRAGHARYNVAVCAGGMTTPTVNVLRTPSSHGFPPPGPHRCPNLLCGPHKCLSHMDTPQLQQVTILGRVIQEICRNYNQGRCTGKKAARCRR